MDEAKTDSITIGECMSTVMPISKTAACLTLSILNDEGYTAFCESDFVVIPHGVLLHYVSGKPPFLCNPTFPHRNIITIAHCTAPRKMDGSSYEAARIVTHFESDYGAAPKVEFRKGQKLTVLNPAFDGRNCLAIEAEVDAAPFLPICRSQAEIRFKGEDAVLAQEIRGKHWMVCYGDYLKEMTYAMKKNGVALRRLA